MILGLVLDLDEDGVLLNLLSGGHGSWDEEDKLLGGLIFGACTCLSQLGRDVLWNALLAWPFVILFHDGGLSPGKGNFSILHPYSVLMAPACL